MKIGFILSWPLIFLLAVLGMLFFFWRQSVSLEELYVEHAQRELLARGKLLSREVEKQINAGTWEALREFCTREGRDSDTRITIVAPDGTVLADTEEPYRRMDNHLTRPEIVGALEAFRAGDGVYQAVRYSTTLGQRLIYCALPIEMENGELYVLRTAFSIHRLDALLARARIEVFFAVLVTALASFLISLIIFRTISRPVRKLCAAAARIAGGEFDVRLPVPGRGAIRELALALSRMAEELKCRIREISREKKERDAIFSALAEGVVVLDPQENILDLNLAARRIFQLPEGAVGKSFRGLVRSGELGVFLSRLGECEEPQETEFSLRLPGGDRELRVRGSQLRWEEGKADSCGIMLVAYDRTQLKKLENFRRDFVANVSHEIKTPLTAIRGAVETLQDGAIADPEAAEKFMRIITVHAERLNSLVQDILSLSKLECRSVDDVYNMVPIDLTQPVQAALKLAQARVDVPQVEIVSRFEAHPVVAADAELIEQACFNLIDNAIRHSGEKERIVVRVSEEDGFARIDVIDHGCGIAPEHLSRIFERFYRVDKARSRKAGGTGLGLAIVKHIAQLHHGSAEATSRPGEGCCFTLRLPLRAGLEIHQPR